MKRVRVQSFLSFDLGCTNAMRVSFLFFVHAGRPISVEPPPSEGHVFESTAQPQPQSHIHRTTTLSLTRTHSSPAANMIIPINLIPPSPLDNSGASPNLGPGPGTGISARNRVVHPLDVTDAPDPEDTLSEKTGDLNEKSGGGANHDTSSKGKKVQRILKERVHKGQAHIHTISRKIGRGSGRHVARLKRSNSAPGMCSRCLSASPLLLA